MHFVAVSASQLLVNETISCQPFDHGLSANGHTLK